VEVGQEATNTSPKRSSILQNVIQIIELRKDSLQKKKKKKKKKIMIIMIMIIIIIIIIITITITTYNNRPKVLIFGFGFRQYFYVWKQCNLYDTPCSKGATISHPPSMRSD
jgi:hypothetical protein